MFNLVAQREQGRHGLPSTFISDIWRRPSCIERMRLTSELDYHRGCVNHISFNATGDMLTSGSDDGQLCLWDVARRKVRTAIRTGHTANIFCTRIMPGTGDNIIATCAGDAEVRVHNVSKEKCTTFRCHCNRVKKMVVEPDNPHVLLSGGEDGTVRNHDLREHHTCVANARDDEDDDRYRAFFTPWNEGCSNVAISQTAEIFSISLSAHRPWLLAVGSSDCHLRVYDRRFMPTAGPKQGRKKEAGRIMRTSPKLGTRLQVDPSSCITGVRISRCGTHVLASYLGGSIYLFDVQGALPGAAQNLHGASSSRGRQSGAPVGGRARAGGGVGGCRRTPQHSPIPSSSGSGEEEASDPEESEMQAEEDEEEEEEEEPTIAGLPNEVFVEALMELKRAGRALARGSHIGAQAHCTSGILLLEGAASATTEGEDTWHPPSKLRRVLGRLYLQRAAAQLGRAERLAQSSELEDPLEVSEDEGAAAEELRAAASKLYEQALVDAEVAVESGVDRGRANYQVGRALVLLGRHEEALQAVDAAYEVSWSEELEALRASLHEHLNIAVEHDAGHGSDRDEDAASEDPPGGCGEEGAGQMEADEVPPQVADSLEAGPRAHAGRGPRSALESQGAAGRSAEGPEGSAREDAVARKRARRDGQAGEGLASTAPSPFDANPSDASGEAGEGSQCAEPAGAAEGGVGTEEESGALGDTEATGADSELEASSEDNEEAELEAGSRQRRSRPTSRQHSIFNRVFGSEVDDGEEEDTDDDMDTDDDSLITDDILMNSSEDEVGDGDPTWIQRYKGHRNMRTVKDVSFLGPHEEYVASGSDNGAMLIWCRYSGRLLFQYKGDSEVVNCIQAHPIDPVIASCGIDTTVKIWTPQDGRTRLPSSLRSNNFPKRRFRFTPESDETDES
ncbi:hypothetical protein CYMTET_54903 [Cymbomonas tetramitiformis]|uniref:Uncharacterized protein n=1 Tax=Cymbomonas tetramitiformis TaxID=36881 RepID=A0AAE0ENI1_9CHLO|nr:hypothetical protein CYMTET_54903 [Cymbomonas tetramitiformis]